jgi:hypothetical protein
MRIEIVARTTQSYEVRIIDPEGRTFRTYTGMDRGLRQLLNRRQNRPEITWKRPSPSPAGDVAFTPWP